MTSATPGSAEAILRQRLKRARNDRDALSQLVGLLIDRKDFLQAAQYLARLADCCPELPGVRLDSARLWLKAGRPRDACDAATAALAAGADPFTAQCLIAETAERAGDAARALRAYRAAIALQPAVAALYNNLGLLLRQSGDLPAAVAAFTEAIARADPESPSAVAALNNRGNTWRQGGRFEEAADDYVRALALEPTNAVTHHNRGLVQLQLNLAHEAVESFRNALVHAPGSVESMVQLVEALLASGDFADAGAALERLLALHPKHARGWFLRAGLAREPTAVTATLKSLLDLRRDASLTDAERSELDFALGELHDRSDDCDEAWRAYRAANHYRRDRVPRGVRQQTLLTGRHMLAMPPASWCDSEDTTLTGAVPLFIVGMPRSGTTLLEQLLGAHPDIAPAGEADYFGPALHWLRMRAKEADASAAPGAWLPDSEARRELREGYVRRLQMLAGAGRDRAMIIDKTPLNFLYVGLLRSLFPAAKFIHCERDPLDTCLSIYFQQFGSLEFTHDLDDIGDVFLNYRALMKHWRGIPGVSMLDVAYEHLVTEPEQVVRGVLAFLQLPWDARCAATSSSARTINTASRWQARQPIYRYAIRRWQRYERALAGLRKRFLEV